MKKIMTLWVRTTEDGRILYTADKKEWLLTPSTYTNEVETYDVELSGQFEVEDEKAI
jgi:hypothetical protein